MGWGLVGSNDHVDAASAFVEEHTTRSEGEESVVFPHAYVQASCPACATLANDDVAGDDRLATEFFDSESFAA